MAVKRIPEEVKAKSESPDENELIHVPDYKRIIPYTKTRDSEGQSATVQFRVSPELSQYASDLIGNFQGDLIPYSNISELARDAFFKHLCTLYGITRPGSFQDRQLQFEREAQRMVDRAVRMRIRKQTIEKWLQDLDGYLSEGTEAALVQAVRELKKWTELIGSLESDEPYWFDQYMRKLMLSQSVLRLLKWLQNGPRRDDQFVLTLGKWYNRAQNSPGKVNV